MKFPARRNRETIRANRELNSRRQGIKSPYQGIGPPRGPRQSTQFVIPAKRVSKGHDAARKSGPVIGAERLGLRERRGLLDSRVCGNDMWFGGEPCFIPRVG